MAKNYQKTKSLYGYVFISLWFIGLIIFFLIPFVQSIVYSFSSMTIDPGKITLVAAGWQNYTKGFLEDPLFRPAFITSLINVITQTPSINLFALFIAIILNQNFKGRTFVRAVFFLPVIITSGVVINIISGDGFLNSLMNGQRSSMMFEAVSVYQIMSNLGFDLIIAENISNYVSQIFNLSWHAGIQILIFLAGLQSIPFSLYEVSRVEGATAWETFWKITFPLILPMVLVNLVYTMIDIFINYSNPMFKLIQTEAGKVNFGYASAMSLMNFVVLFLLIGIVYLVLNKKIYYAVD